MRILKIGSNSFALPECEGLVELLDTLEGLAENSLETDYSDDLREIIYIKSKRCEIEIKVVEDRLVFEKRPASTIKEFMASPAIPADEDIGRVTPVQDPHANIGVDNF